MYAEAEEQPIIRAKRRNFRNLGSLRSHLLALSHFTANIGLWSLGLLDLRRCPCIICVVLFIPTLSTSLSKELVMGGAYSFLLLLACGSSNLLQLATHGMPTIAMHFSLSVVANNKNNFM